MNVGCQSRDTQTDLAGVASASPTPLAPAVPTLQTADMPSSPTVRTTCLLSAH